MAFARLLTRLAPTDPSINKGKIRAHAIRARLKGSFGVTKSFLIGSSVRGTAIRGYSDVDLFAVVPREQLKWGVKQISSNTLIRNMRNDLSERYTATEIRRDAQAIVVAFGGGSEPVDVVPAVFHSFKTEHKVPVYAIPDGDGGWLESAPQAHNNYIEVANTKSGGKLRKTIQLLKHWRNARTPSIPLSSIHLELLLASTDVCVGAKGYSTCLLECFALMRSRKCIGLVDPVGLAGTLYAVRTEAQLTRLRDSIEHAFIHATAAVAAERSRDCREASRQWNIVFNGEFA